LDGKSSDASLVNTPLPLSGLNWCTDTGEDVAIRKVRLVSCVPLTS
jgi:hypothetical protein